MGASFQGPERGWTGREDIQGICVVLFQRSLKTTLCNMIATLRRFLTFRLFQLSSFVRLCFPTSPPPVLQSEPFDIIQNM